MKNVLPCLLHLQSTECFQQVQVKIVSEVAHDNYMLHKFVSDRGDSSLECFNRATRNYELRQSVPVRYHTREKLCSVESCKEG